MIERLAHASKPTTSTVGRVAAIVSVVRLGAQLWPEARRAFRRYPAASMLVTAGLVAGLLLLRSGVSESQHERRLH